MKKFSLTELIIFIVFAELVGAVSALLAGDFRGLYTELIQPPLAPPSWVFPVVWTALYALMGITSYMIYRSDNYRRNSALTVYLVQLAVNFSWSIIFFRFQLLTLAAIIAVILTILVGIMICMFLSIRKKAGYLNIPYLLWMIFASYLAIGTMLLN